MAPHTAPIVKDEKALRAVARAVPREDIARAHIQDMIARMSAALAQEEDGVALAAPQIGESLRLFIVSGRVLTRLGRHKKKSGVAPLPDAVFINPVLTKISKKKQTVEEGCLSLRYLYGKVRRAARVSLEAYDASGTAVARGAGGLLAQIFQHEIDHLNGILFTDTATDIINMPPQE